MDFVSYWSERAELPAKQFALWLAIGKKLYAWRKRYGKVNEHNGKIPRDHWLEAWERQAIIDFHTKHPIEGYRRLTFMMLDENVVCVSPSTTYRVLRSAGLLDRWNPSRRVRAQGSYSHWLLIATGTSTLRISTSAAPSTICAPCWTDTVDTSCIGRSESR